MSEHHGFSRHLRHDHVRHSQTHHSEPTYELGREFGRAKNAEEANALWDRLTAELYAPPHPGKSGDFKHKLNEFFVGFDATRSQHHIRKPNEV